MKSALIVLVLADALTGTWTLNRGRTHYGGGADAKPLCAGGDVRPHDVHRGADAEGMEVVLGEPHGVVARPIHDLDALECALVDGLDGDAPLRPAEELKNADLHRTRLGTRHCSRTNACACPERCVRTLCLRRL